MLVKCREWLRVVARTASDREKCSRSEDHSPWLAAIEPFRSDSQVACRILYVGLLEESGLSCGNTNDTDVVELALDWGLVD